MHLVLSLKLSLCLSSLPVNENNGLVRPQKEGYAIFLKISDRKGAGVGVQGVQNMPSFG